MKSLLLAFVIGATCGALGMFLANRPADEGPDSTKKETEERSINPDRNERKIASLEKKIAEKQQKITDKLNRSIEKRKDDLRLSVHDLVASQWGDLASKYLDLPASEQPSSPGNE